MQGFPKRLQQHKATAKHRRKQNLGLKRSLWEIYDYAFSPQLGQLNSCLKSSTNEAATIPPTLLPDTNPQGSSARSKRQPLWASHSASGGGPGVLQRPGTALDQLRVQLSKQQTWAGIINVCSRFSFGTMAPFIHALMMPISWGNSAHDSHMEETKTRDREKVLESCGLKSLDYKSLLMFLLPEHPKG